MFDHKSGYLDVTEIAAVHEYMPYSECTLMYAGSAFIESMGRGSKEGREIGASY